MPQAAQEFTSYAEGGALVMPQSEHFLTRTFGGSAVTLRNEADMSSRDVFARDIRDVRRMVGPKYDQGLRDLIHYYKQNFPKLIER